jgi:hypothetical protein
MNDPLTLWLYTKMKLFQSSEPTPNTELQFPPTLNLEQRQIVYTLTVKINFHFELGLDDYIRIRPRTVPQDSERNEKMCSQPRSNWELICATEENNGTNNHTNRKSE